MALSVFRDSVFCVLGEEQKKSPPSIAKTARSKTKGKKRRKILEERIFLFLELSLFPFPNDDC
jgi:hypothetical protein